MDSFSNPQPAKLKYCDGHFEVIAPGGYVVCAVTGRRIPLDQLKYWSVERQEAYATPQEVDQRRREIHNQSQSDKTEDR